MAAHGLALQKEPEAVLAAVEAGLPLSALERLRERGMSFTEIAAVVPPRTIKHRRQRREPLSIQESDRVVRVERIWAAAERLFGTRDKALRWLRGSDHRWPGRSRLSLLQTEAGGRVVAETLIQISEGMFT